MTELLLANGRVYDPKNGINGEIMDLPIRAGKIADRVSPRARKIDLRGRVVMPGGVDVHSHITGSKINAARIMRPEDVRRKIMPRTRLTRSATGLTVPNLYMIGYTYARMGYTTVMEGAVPALKARHTHEEMSAIPIIDKAAMILLGNNWLMMRYLADGEMELAREYASWFLEATKGYGIKIVNPGGTEAWGWGGNVEGIHDTVPHFDITPAEIVEGLQTINEELNLPTSVHLHPNGLGVPGNFATTLETLDLVKGRTPSTHRDQLLHIVHLQFHSYGGSSWRDFSSQADEVAKYLNSRDNITADAGAVVFGWSTTMTADGPFEHSLQSLTHNKWTNADVEAETGAGIVPHFYSRKNAVSAVQWCTGLELMLLARPEKIYLSTDNPNAGPFYRYPHVLRLLMDRKYRESLIERAHKVARRSILPSIDREYDLYEISMITRSQTAKALGMDDKGHLGEGADADVSVYDMEPGVKKGIERSLQNAFLVVKGGRIVVRDGDVTDTPSGRTLWTRCRPGKERDSMIDDLRDHFKYYSIQRANYAVAEEYVAGSTPNTPEVRD